MAQEVQAERWKDVYAPTTLKLDQYKNTAYDLCFQRRWCCRLEETGLEPHYLELELTESQLLDSVEHIIGTFHQLRDLGVKLAIDDFGTGYSSLSYLKRFPVDYVTIDQTFISGLGQGTEDPAITGAIIVMVHSLKLKVVAEGVDNSEQLAFLKDQGCDEVQGYLISGPFPVEEAAQSLANRGLDENTL